MIEKVRALLPQIAAGAAQAERERMAPVQSIELLKSIELHRAFQPKVYGGLEMSLPDFEQCLVVIAGACASTAWAFALLAHHSHMLAMFPKRLQDEIWAHDPDALASSSIAPFGRSEEVEGGVLFSGEMGWSSGCDHAQWAILGFMRTNAAGEKALSFVVVPRSDYTIRDTWFTAAMRGSGSKTIVVDKVFVPEHRIQNIKEMAMGLSEGVATSIRRARSITSTSYRSLPACSPRSAWVWQSECFRYSKRSKRVESEPIQGPALAARHQR